MDGFEKPWMDGFVTDYEVQKDQQITKIFFEIV